jgi:PAS domain S-box-containing protein
MHLMPVGPDGRKGPSGHGAAGPRQATGAPGRPDDAAAEPGPVQDDQALAGRVAQLEAANAALRAEAERTRLILENATDYAIVTLDPEGRVTGWNEGATRIFGHGDAEILGRSGEVWFPAEDRAAGVLAAELRRAADHGRAANERWHLRKDGSRFWASGLMMPLRDHQGRPLGFLNILRDRTEARAEQERRALLLAELNHRVKNTLATVQSVAAQTERNAATPGAFREAFEARLMALARSHDVLIRSDWEGAPLSEVAGLALQPHQGGPCRVVVAGPAVHLAPNAVVTLSLAFHELATNAAKHGALSAPGGGVEVRWSLKRPRNKAPTVEILWRERGGPAVRPPERRGFGSRLLERGLAQEFGGAVRLDFAPEGVECRISLPLRTGKVTER